MVVIDWERNWHTASDSMVFQPPDMPAQMLIRNWVGQEDWV